MTIKNEKNVEIKIKLEPFNYNDVFNDEEKEKAKQLFRENEEQFNDVEESIVRNYDSMKEEDYRLRKSIVDALKNRNSISESL